MSSRSFAARGLTLAAFVAILSLALLASGIVGYYLGAQERPAAVPAPAPTPVPTWTDQEVTSVPFGSTHVLYTRCTYHRADGSVVVREYRMGGIGGFGSTPTACPLSP